MAGLTGVLALGGCTWTPSTTVFSVESVGSPSVLTPNLPFGVYVSSDANTADLYLTDLPLERLADAKDPLAELSGTIVHVHMFLVPSAGRTPIDPTACNASIRQAILSSGAVGIYSGGGFFYPSDSTGAREFGGQLVQGTLRLSRATANFDDLLGPARASGSLRTTLDEPATAAIAARMESLVRATPALPTP